MAILNIGDLLTLDVPDNDQDIIGISCSGGADSSILLYILAKFLKNKIHVFTVSNRLKHHSNVLPAAEVVKKCIELTENYNIVHHIEYTETFIRDEFVSELVDKVNSGLVSKIYTGTTALPPVSDMLKFTINLDHEVLVRRLYGNERPNYSHENLAYHPFTNIHKKDIKRLYEHFGLLDILFPLTRSCESLTISSGHCGECWWCQERQWAFG